MGFFKRQKEKKCKAPIKDVVVKNDKRHRGERLRLEREPMRSYSYPEGVPDNRQRLHIDRLFRLGNHYTEQSTSGCSATSRQSKFSNYQVTAMGRPINLAEEKKESFAETADMEVDASEPGEPIRFGIELTPNRGCSMFDLFSGFSDKLCGAPAAQENVEPPNPVEVLPEPDQVKTVPREISFTTGGSSSWTEHHELLSELQEEETLSRPHSFLDRLKRRKNSKTLQRVPTFKVYVDKPKRKGRCDDYSVLTSPTVELS